MHVGFSLLTLFPGRVGGSETYVRGLLREFARSGQPERVTVLANRHVMAAYGELAHGPVRLHHVRSYRPGDRAVTRALAMATARALPCRTARDVPPAFDVVHFPVTVPIPRVEAPSVVTVFDLQHRDLPQLFSRAERAYRHWAYDGAARAATFVVTTSAYSRDRLVEFVGIAPERVAVIHMGIDHERFGPDPGADDERWAASLGLPPRYVFYPANAWPHKNHERLIEALAAVSDRDLTLVLTGQAYGKLDALLALARRHGIEQRVHHLGQVPAPVLPLLYRRAQALIFPSLYEGFGAPPLEAMACGCPVASSTNASLGEICGDAALAFEPEESASVAVAIERIVSDEELRARLRVAGLARARSFSWAEAARRHRQVYERAARR